MWLEKYNSYLNNLLQLFNACKTLLYAEGQQRAFEIQESNNQMNEDSSSAMSFEIDSPPDTFFQELYNLRIKYFGSAIKEHDFVFACKNFWGKCSRQPIPLAILPALLTAFVKDVPEFETVYPYMKYKDRRLSVKDKQNIVSLFDDICKLVNRTFPEELPSEVPIFNWEKIEKTLVETWRGDAKDDNELEPWLVRLRILRSQNGLLSKEEKELREEPIGRAILALGKMCNLNVYITVEALRKRVSKCKRHQKKCKRYEINREYLELLPLKIRNAQEALIKGEVIVCKNQCLPKYEIDAYECLNNMYCTIPCIPQFSYLALLRYFHLPLDAHYSSLSDGMSKMIQLFERITYKYTTLIIRQFKEENRTIFMYNYELSDGDDENNAEKEQLVKITHQRMVYNLEDSERRLNYIKKAKEASIEIAKSFHEEEYRKFIKDVEHFTPKGFQQYMLRFCQDHHIDSYNKASTKTICYINEDAFTTIMTLTQGYLMEHFSRFWRDSVEKVLFATNFQDGIVN